jgi:predicted ATP-grasp superfamily ATP-dependent carboligase
MRIFLYEYTCAGGVAEHSLSGSLQAEGWAMLSALMHDFGRIPGVEVWTILHEHCAYNGTADVCRRIPATEEEAVFRTYARQADYTLVIAPEFDDLLATRCRWVEEAGGKLLGPSPQAVALTADKLALCQHLRSHGIPTPRTFLFNESTDVPTACCFPLVWKPRHGAGSQATFLVLQRSDLHHCSEQARAEGWQGEAVMQSHVPGRSASVAFLLGPHVRTPLLPAEQLLSTDGRFHYLGGSIPLPPAESARAIRVAQRAVETVPGLCGYVGVDVVLGDRPDGSRDWVIEINPRLTTSYVGLRALAEANLAEAMLRIAMGGEPLSLAWRAGTVRFQTNGQLFLEQEKDENR